MCAFAIEKADIPLIWTSEEIILNSPSEWIVTSENVLFFHSSLLNIMVFNMRDGTQSRTVRWSPREAPRINNPHLPDPYYDRLGRVFMTGHYLLTTMNSYLQLLDLKTLEAKMSDTTFTPPMSLLSIFDDGKMAAMQMGRRLYFLNLESGDPKEIYRGRKEINLEDTRPGASNKFRSHAIRGFCEVSKDLCFREIYTSSKKGASCTRKRFEIIALKPLRLSKALETWLNLVGVTH